MEDGETEKGATERGYVDRHKGGLGELDSESEEPEAVEGAAEGQMAERQMESEH
jgi:hypothetical protein